MKLQPNIRKRLRKVPRKQKKRNRWAGKLQPTACFIDNSFQIARKLKGGLSD